MAKERRRKRTKKQDVAFGQEDLFPARKTKDTFTQSEMYPEKGKSPWVQKDLKL